MFDHTYIESCDENFELNNSMNSRELEENCESSDVGDFVDTLDELIIACVQSYPHLYNKSNANYKDHMMKQKSWEEIAQTCNISDIEVQQRWKRLKDRFSKQRRLNDYATRAVVVQHKQ
ncbi:transcription factor Adf-1-like [Nylanderia fulva]|uniref:transcription factor Adf-1-like n=1 Tax=Nylanderia fulva TaxID=613905 RepID=UPI0010FB2072|nr:transcription factor Adf-1-like [Nylanderia fulva]